MAEDGGPAPDPPAAADERVELDRLRTRIDALETGRGPRPARHRGRSALAVVLVVLGCLLAPLGVAAAWSADIVGDTDRYVDTVRPLAANRDVQNAAARRVTDAVMSQLDLEDLLRGAAPAQRPLLEKALGKLGNSLEGAVRSFVQDKAQAVVASDAFERIWAEANRRAHSSLNKALTGSGGGAVKLEDDRVTIDLAPVIEEVTRRLVDNGLTVAGQIPEIHTDFTVLESENVGRAKTGFRILQLAGGWLPVVAVLLVAAGVLLYPRRRRALIAAGLGFALATLLLGVAVTVFRTVYLDALPADISQSAAGAVYDTLTRYLRTGARVAVTLGLVVTAGAWLTGPGRYAVLVRRLWHAGVGAVRTTAGRAGLRTGPVGPFVLRFQAWIAWVLVAGTVVAYALWPHPTGWVVLGLALALLFVLSVVDFLAADPTGKDAPA